MRSSLAARIALLVVASCSALSTRAETLAELEERWLSEAQRLESRLDRYDALSKQQERTLAALQAARTAVDTTIVNPEASVETLRDLESKLTDARDEALKVAEAAASARREIYDILEEVDELAAVVERVRRVGEIELVAPSGLDGLWRCDWGDRNEFGIVKLATSGNLVSGTYRLTNGRSGSLRGTIAGQELRLEVIAAAAGAIGDIVMTMDSGGESASGQFNRRELTGPGRVSGALEFRRLSEEEAYDLATGK